MKAKRKYTVKDVDMLITASTMLESAIANKAFLQQNRSTWADPFFDDLKKRIDTAVQEKLGMDSAKALRLSTLAVKSVQNQAIRNLALLKVQLTEDFKKDPGRKDEILKQLGFTQHLARVQAKDQEALISLLYMFRENLPEIQTEIEAKGTDKNLLQAIMDQAGLLKNNNVEQENFKGGRKSITAANKTEFNEIYDEVISICRIAAKLFAGRPDMKDQFSFNKVSKALNVKTVQETTPQAA